MDSVRMDMSFINWAPHSITKLSTESEYVTRKLNQYYLVQFHFLSIKCWLSTAVKLWLIWRSFQRLKQCIYQSWKLQKIYHEIMTLWRFPSNLSMVKSVCTEFCVWMSPNPSPTLLGDVMWRTMTHPGSKKLLFY